MAARALRPLVVLALLAPGLAGCLAPSHEPLARGTFPALALDEMGRDARGAEVRRSGDGILLTWRGIASPLETATSNDERILRPVVEHGFPLGAAVGAVRAEAALPGEVGVMLVDDRGGIVCQGWGLDRAACESPAPPGSDRGVWAVRLLGGYAPEAPRNYVAEVALSPGPGGRLGDVLAGTDPSIAFASSWTGHTCGEPTLGATRSGAVFVVACATVLRSRDAGATWHDVSPPGNDRVTIDPYVHVDARTGRVLVDHLWVGCSALSWSADEGASWLTNPIACGVPVNDHQKITVGGHPGPAKLFDGAIYYSENGAWTNLTGRGAQALVVSRSLDGGATWRPRVALTSLEADYRTGGPVSADLVGNVYVPVYLRDADRPADVGVVVSNDYGDTWRLVRASRGGTGALGIDPEVALDAAGNAYLFHEGADGRVWMATSRDFGATWAEPVAVSPPGLRSAVFPAPVAGDAGKVAVAYLATPDTDRGANGAPPWARWHLYVSFADDALAAEPVWRTSLATPAWDPLQLGSICTQGSKCAGGNRNLFDFIDAALLPDGRVIVAYTDGCVECTHSTDSRAGRILVAYEQDGPRLRDGEPLVRGVRAGPARANA